MAKREALIIAMDTVARGTTIDSPLLKRFRKALTTTYNQGRDLDLNLDLTFNVKTIGNSNIISDTSDDIMKFFQQDADVLFFYLRANDTYTAIELTDKIKIRYLDLFQKIKQSKANHLIVILDTLHSHVGLKSLSDFNMSEKTLLLSSDGGGKAKGFMPFTEHLLTAIEGQAADIEGYITMANVYGYIDSVLDSYSQRPTYITHVTGFLPICRVGSRVNSELANLANILEHFSSAEYLFPLDPSYEPKRNIGEEELPPSVEKHVVVFRELQEFARLGLVEPCLEELDPLEQHMYFAAMQSKHCRLTALGKAYREKYARIDASLKEMSNQMG